MDVPAGLPHRHAEPTGEQPGASAEGSPAAANSTRGVDPSGVLAVADQPCHKHTTEMSHVVGDALLRATRLLQPLVTRSNL